MSLSDREEEVGMSFSPNKHFIASDEVAGLKKDKSVDSIRYKARSQDDEEEEESVQLTMGKKQGAGETYYTVEDAVNELGFGPFQILVTVFCGMIWMSDAMELMVLAVLSPIVECEWGLSKIEEALITSVVFIGFFFGGVFWGWMADALGRKISLFILNIVVIVFAVASAFSPTYALLLVFRFGAGFGIGGAAQAVTYYVEFLPNRMRGVCVVLLELWWAVGSIFAALLAMIIIPRMEQNIGWRVYLGVCAAPLLLVVVFFPFIPESARFYLLGNDHKKAEKVIRWIARFNFRKVPKGKLVTQEEKELHEARATRNSSTDDFAEDAIVDAPPIDDTEGEVDPLLDHDQLALTENYEMNAPQPPLALCDKLSIKVLAQLAQFKKLFSGGMWKTTVLLALIWFGCAWLYYGAVLLATTILQDDPHCRAGLNESDSNLTNESELSCFKATQDEAFYVKIVWTAAAEFPGVLVTMVIIELIGRKWTIAIEFTATAVFYGLLFICADDIVLTVFLFGVRAFATGVFQAVYVYTPEVFPTAVRGVAMGMNTSIARIGALITPFVAQVLFHWNDYVTISLYTVSCLILAGISLLLPIETKGRSLKDSKG